MGIEQRRYGDTGLRVSALGLGCGGIGGQDLDENHVGHLLNAALDAGITLFDTAPSYGHSEVRIGRHLAHRRSETVLATKLGYGVPGVADWTGPCITAGIELALQRLRTDWIDIVHLHSCPTQTLQRDDVMLALEALKQSGKVRAIGYSGENADLRHAAEMRRFDGLMASLNVFDQRVLDDVLPAMRDAGTAFIAKRPLANAPWRYTACPQGNYCEPYWHRMQAMDLPTPPQGWGELALRFVVSQAGVASAIVGTSRLAHLHQAIGWAQAGALPAAQCEELQTAFRRHDQNWLGQV